jgi:hypothetical protein
MRTRFMTGGLLALTGFRLPDGGVPAGRPTRVPGLLAPDPKPRGRAPGNGRRAA